MAVSRGRGGRGEQVQRTTTRTEAQLRGQQPQCGRRPGGPAVVAGPGLSTPVETSGVLPSRLTHSFLTPSPAPVYRKVEGPLLAVRGLSPLPAI